MSRYCEMTITVNDMAPDRKDAIEEAARAEWDFGDCYEGEGSMTLGGRGSLGGGESEADFAQRITKAICQANGQFCAVEVCATDLENAPYEIFQLDEGDYERQALEAAEARDQP